MPLSAGDKLGPYEIIEQIGAGGMGVVYRARDPRVGRDVAIKLSGKDFSDRFEREVRAVAALNHANICTLYDVGPNYLVMEFVDGESPKGPLPFDTALGYARQIADALDAAHEKGIVHRDLKPANIKIRSDGTVKVLDFGLAKIEPGSATASDPSNSPTVTHEGTKAGVILGTAAYMAPEQARGKAVDKRADIWAFGAVFYEMITGRRAFDGDDLSTIIAAVIRAETSWDDVPARARHLLESCLEKDPRKRLRDIGDVWKLLGTGRQPAAPPPRSVAAGWIAAGALAIVAAVALWAPWRAAPARTSQPLVRLDVDLGSEVSLLPLAAPTFSSLIISPDATRLVFVGSVSGGTPRLFTRKLEDAKVTELGGTQGASHPFFSPDGQWVAFWSRGKLAKVPVEGGAVVPLGDLAVMAGGHWTDDGSLVVGTGTPGPVALVRVSADGGAPSPLVKLAPGELFHTYPHVLPGGKAALVAIVADPPSWEATRIEIVSFVDGRRQTVVRAATSPRYLPSGHLMYTTRAGILAVGLDVGTGATHGPAVPIAVDAAFDQVTGGAQFSVSRDGTVVYRKNSGGTASAEMLVRWLDATGKQEPLLDKADLYGKPRLSPDGGRVAIAVRDGADQDIWVFDPRSGSKTRLTFGGKTYSAPVWMPDGRHVVFGAMVGGISWARADGAGQPQLLTVRNAFQYPTSFSPVGKRLAFVQIDGIPQVWSVDVEEREGQLLAGTPVQWLTTRFSDSNAVFSPTGEWVAYDSNESGRTEVYVRPFSAPPSGEQNRAPVSDDGGGVPVWAPKSSDILYLSRGRIMAVSYTTRGGTFVADKPRVWAANFSGAAAFDVAPDGKRVAVVVPATPREAPRPDHTIVLLQNVFDELRRRAPAVK